VRTLAHNTYIEIAAELGIPSLVLFLGILIASFVEAEGRAGRRFDRTFP